MQREFKNAHFTTPPPFLAELRSPASIPVPSPSGVSPLYTSARFAGWATNSGVANFTKSSVLYTEPGLQPVSCDGNTNPAVSIWSAIGVANGPGGQDGTLSLPNNNHNSFWEVFPDINNLNNYYGAYMFRATAGDQIRANVNYSNGTFGGTVSDVSTGVVNGWSQGTFSGTLNFTEAYVEQPIGRDMADFGSVPFAYSQGNGQPISSFPHVASQNSPNATVGGIDGNGGFTVTWHHC